jgi:PAS domain S-box-containing protein
VLYTTLGSLALGAVYYYAGKFGLSLAFLNASASAIWPPAGIALAAVLLWGGRLWPGIFAGAFLVNISTQGSFGTSLGIALGNTVEALLAAALVRQFAGGARVFERARTILKFVALAAILSTAVSATIGVTSLSFEGLVGKDTYWPTWLTWWLGDMVSDLTICPLLVVWFTQRLDRFRLNQLLIGTGLLAILLLVCEVIFVGQPPFGGTDYPLEYLAIPPLVLASFLFGVRGATAAACITSAIALWGTLHNVGPFATGMPNQSLLLLASFNGTAAVTALVLAAVVSERQQAEQRLQTQDAVSRALAESRSLTEAAPRILQALAELGGWQIGAIWQAHKPADELTCVEVWQHPSKSFPRFAAATRQSRLAPSSLPGRVWANGAAVWVPDISKNPEFQRADAAKAEGLRAAVCFPIKFGEKVIGVVDCFSTKVREPDKNFLQILEGIGNQLGQFIERKEADYVRATLAAIIESSEDAVLSKDLEGTVTSWNPGAERLLGFSAVEIVGQSVLRLVPEELQPEEIGIVARLRRGESIKPYETICLTKDGRRVHVSVRVSPVRNESGAVIGASKIARDITERKNAERALQEAQSKLTRHALELERIVAERTAKLSESNAELEAFSYSLSHDMRAPLRAISGFTKIVLAEHGPKLDALGRDYLERTVEAAARLDRLIQDVLAVSRLSRQEMKLRPLDVEKQVRDIIHERAELQPPQAEVQVSSPLLPMMGHEASFTQCLTNLLSNAVKFVAPGVKPQVRVYSEPVDGQVRLWVEDNGIGIDAAGQERLFKIFQRLHPQTEYEGTGIGLAIVRKAVERMGGRAGVESEPGRGSRFWVQLRSPG